MTRVLPATQDSIGRAAQILREGGLVAFPTETVYGIGAAAENSEAVRAIFLAKGRPAEHPVIIHLADSSALADWATDVPPAALRLAEAFWPGPLTMILRRSARASDLVTGGLETVGLRVPGHPVAQQLLAQFGGALAAPSANRFGRVSPTCARHVLEELNGLVEVILDGGECQIGLESTIVDLSRGAPAVLRPGGITHQRLAEVLGTLTPTPPADAPRASGGMASHYAPRARVELLRSADLANRARELTKQGMKVAVMLREHELPELKSETVVLRLPASDEALARALYAMLRRVDELGCDVVLTTEPAEAGLGAAIADRLRKAAGPRA